MEQLGIIFIVKDLEFHYTRCRLPFACFVTMFKYHKYSFGIILKKKRSVKTNRSLTQLQMINLANFLRSEIRVLCNLTVLFEVFEKLF